MQRRWRPSSSRIIEDRLGHSTEEGGVQSGHMRSGEVSVQSRRRSNFVGSQRTDDVTVQYRQVSSQVTQVKRVQSAEERRQKVQPQLGGRGLTQKEMTG